MKKPESNFQVQGISKQISEARKSKAIDSNECSAGTTPVKLDLKYEESRPPAVQVGIP